jgi:hypothetical protein
MNRLPKLPAALLACAAWACAAAETASPVPATPIAPAVPVGSTLSPSHMAAALDLARALQLNQYLETTLQNMAPPGMRREILRRVLSQRLDVKALEAFAARAYGETFSEDELRQLAAFYRTEAGRKLQSRLPDLQKNVSQAISTSPEMVSNLFVSGCAAAAVAGAAEQARQFQTTVGQTPPSVDDVVRNLDPLLAKAEASCSCMFGKAMAVAKDRDPSKAFGDPAVKAAAEESVRSGACPKPL